MPDYTSTESFEDNAPLLHDADEEEPRSGETRLDVDDALLYDATTSTEAASNTENNHIDYASMYAGGVAGGNGGSCWMLLVVAVVVVCRL